MDKIIINVVDRKAEFMRRIVLEVNVMLQQCDFVTVGEDVMLDRDTDFFTFGFDLTGGDRQLAIVTGEGHDMSGQTLVEVITASLKDRFIVIKEDETQIWLREKAA